MQSKKFKNMMTLLFTLASVLQKKIILNCITGNGMFESFLEFP